MSSILFEVHTRLSNMIGQFVTKKLLEGCYDNKVMEVIIPTILLLYTVQPVTKKSIPLMSLCNQCRQGVSVHPQRVHEVIINTSKP